MIPDLTNPWIDRRVAWVIAAAAFLGSAASLVILLSGLASGQPEAAAEIPWYIWLGALCAILLGSVALAFWLTPRQTKVAGRSWPLFGLTIFLLAWLPLAGMFVLFLRMTDLANSEFRFSSVLREVKQLGPDSAHQDMYRSGAGAPAGPDPAMQGPGLVVVRTGARGESVDLLSGTVGRMERRAGNLAELATVVVIYRFDHVLACAVIDWPRRHTVEWYEWKDIPDKYMVQVVPSARIGFSRQVVKFAGGPQWDALLRSLGNYESPEVMEEKTLTTLAVLYAAGLLILVGVVAVSGIRRLQARA